MTELAKRAVILRLTGIRCEELLELTHHGITEYRLPATGELVPLLQIAPSKTDTERLLLVSPELADVSVGDHQPAPRPRRRRPADRLLRRPGTGLEPCDAAAVSAVHRQREPGIHPQRDPQAAHRRARRDRPDRRHRRPAHVLPARLPKNLRDRRHHERPAAPHRPGHLRAQDDRHHDRPSTPPRRSRPTGRSSPAAAPPGPARSTVLPPTKNGTPSSPTSRSGKVSVGTCARAFASPCVHEHVPLTELTDARIGYRFGSTDCDRGACSALSEPWSSLRVAAWICCHHVSSKYGAWEAELARRSGMLRHCRWPGSAGSEETGDPLLPFRLVDEQGAEVPAVSEFLHHMLADDARPSSLRSYAYELLAWFRFLDAVGVAWDLAGRAEARDFALWLKTVRKPARQRRPDAPAPGSVNPVTGKATPGRELRGPDPAARSRGDPVVL